MHSLEDKKRRTGWFHPSYRRLQGLEGRDAQEREEGVQEELRRKRELIQQGLTLCEEEEEAQKPFAQFEFIDNKDFHLGVSKEGSLFKGPPMHGGWKHEATSIVQMEYEAQVRSEFRHRPKNFDEVDAQRIGKLAEGVMKKFLTRLFAHSGIEVVQTHHADDVLNAADSALIFRDEEGEIAHIMSVDFFTTSAHESVDMPHVQRKFGIAAQKMFDKGKLSFLKFVRATNVEGKTERFSADQVPHAVLGMHEDNILALTQAWIDTGEPRGRLEDIKMERIMLDALAHQINEQLAFARAHRNEPKVTQPLERLLAHLDALRNELPIAGMPHDPAMRALYDFASPEGLEEALVAQWETQAVRELEKQEALLADLEKQIMELGARLGTLQNRFATPQDGAPSHEA